MLNTEGCIRTDESGWTNKEFADNAATVLSERFATPLQNVGLTAQATELLNHWHNLLEYAHEYSSVTTTAYLACWHCIFTSQTCTTWKVILLLIKLLFTIPISNANPERVFSKLKQVKTLHNSSLSQNLLESLLQISEDGLNFKNYVLPAVKTWLSKKDRCLHQTSCKTYE